MTLTDRLTAAGYPVPAEVKALDPPPAKPVYANGLREARQDELTESLIFGTGPVDPDANLTAGQGGSAYFRRLSAGTRDLPQMQADKALRLAYSLWDSNPLARRIIDMTRDFAVGDGITVTASAAPVELPEGATPEARQRADAAAEAARLQIQRVIDRFWQDPYNRMDLKLPAKVADLGLAGELVVPVFVNPANGHVRLGVIDPERIEMIVTNPENAEDLREIVLKAPGASEKPRLKVIRLDEDANSSSFGRMVGVKEGELSSSGDVFVGACFYFAVNKPSSAKRGRSDLLVVLDHVDGYDALVFGELDRALLLKTFVWDVTMTGKSDIEIAQYMKDHGARPQPGAIRAHNEMVQWSAVTPDLKAADAAVGADLLLSLIATGSGLPKTWLNGLMDVNRAAAAEMSEPAIRHLTQRQQYVGYIVEQLAIFQLDCAELHGRIAKRANVEGDVYPEPWPIVVNTPEFRPKDLQAAGQTLQAVAQALAVMRADGAIDVDVEQEVFVALAGQLGVEVDLDALRERLKTADTEAGGGIESDGMLSFRRKFGSGTKEDDGSQIEDEIDGILASMRRNGHG